MQLKTLVLTACIFSGSSADWLLVAKIPVIFRSASPPDSTSFGAAKTG
jgi:hypothetical protein